MLEQILPKHLFDKVVNMKAGKPLHSKPLNLDDLGLGNSEGAGGLSDQSKDNVKLDALYDSMVESVKKSNTPEQVEAILGTIEREQQEVMEMIEREGGDLDEIIATVRARTRQRQMEILEGLEKHRIQDAEIISETKDKK